jgi:hypothetical protein
MSSCSSTNSNRMMQPIASAIATAVVRVDILPRAPPNATVCGRGRHHLRPPSGRVVDLLIKYCSQCGRGRAGCSRTVVCSSCWWVATAPIIIRLARCFLSRISVRILKWNLPRVLDFCGLSLTTTLPAARHRQPARAPRRPPLSVSGTAAAALAVVSSSQVLTSTALGPAGTLGRIVAEVARADFPQDVLDD